MCLVKGFGLRVGGGMANTPRISRDVGVFVPVEQAVEVLAAVTNAWQRDLKYRISRAKARANRSSSIGSCRTWLLKSQ